MPIRLQTPRQTPLDAALRACAGSLGLVFVYSCSYNLLLFAPSIYLLQIYDRVLSSRSGDTLLMLTLIVAFAVAVALVAVLTLPLLIAQRFVGRAEAV